MFCFENRVVKKRGKKYQFALGPKASLSFLQSTRLSYKMIYVFAVMTIKMRAMTFVVQTRELFVTCLPKVSESQ